MYNKYIRTFYVLIGGQFMFRLSKNLMTDEEHLERQNYYYESGKNLKESMSSFKFNLRSKLATTFILGSIDSYDMTEIISIPIASDTEVLNRYGEIISKDDDTCLGHVTKLILDYFGFDFAIQNILNEIYDLYDESVEMYAIDDIINYIASLPLNSIGITRIDNVNKLLSNIANGIIVPVRVNNAIYYNDDTLTGSHYVILLGFIEGDAYIIDSSVSGCLKTLSTSRLFESILVDENLICAWDLSPCI